jgi:hypothetical protein
VSYSSQIETLFAGPSVTSTHPPYNGLAVGPNHIVMNTLSFYGPTNGSHAIQLHA